MARARFSCADVCHLIINNTLNMICWDRTRLKHQTKLKHYRLQWQLCPRMQQNIPLITLNNCKRQKHSFCCNTVRSQKKDLRSTQA